jgi:acyl carrier protein
MTTPAVVPTISTRSIIESLLRRIAAEHGRTLAPLTDDLKLLESGLDSMSVAVVVMHLADLFGTDPFNSGRALDSPVTLGDFIRMYENCEAQSSG